LVSSLGSEFDGFLFASIGEDRNGMRLSVVSALARLDLDPWQEAAELDDLQWKTATVRLASRIAALPDALSAHRDSGTIAACLITLLPSRVHTRMRSPKTLPEPAADAVIRPQSIIYIYLIFMALAVVAPFILTGNQPPAAAGKLHASASSGISPGVPIGR
jgi:hypothetical protein